MRRFNVAFAIVGALAVIVGVTVPSNPRADEASVRQQVEAAIRKMSQHPFAYLEEGGEAMGMMQCRGASIDLWLVGLTPAQAFPQPDLSLAFGQTTWTKTPYAHLKQGRPEIVVEFFAHNDVLGTRRLLETIAAGTPVEVSFNGQLRRLSVAQVDRASFVKDCREHLIQE